MARSEGAEGPAQHLADAIAAAFARTEQPGEHLAVHAPKLAIKPRLQILRRHRRSLLLRLEHPYCSAVEDHVNRAPGVGLHRSFNLRIGITREFKVEAVKLVRERGVAVVRAARDLNVHENVLRKWVKEFGADPQHAFPGHGQMKSAQVEIERLRREVQKLKAERDILKKAADYFAKEST